MRLDVLMLAVGFVLGNPTARGAVIKMGDRLDKIISEQISALTHNTERKDNNDDTQVI